MWRGTNTCEYNKLLKGVIWHKLLCTVLKTKILRRIINLNEQNQRVWQNIFDNSSQKVGRIKFTKLVSSMHNNTYCMTFFGSTCLFCLANWLAVGFISVEPLKEVPFIVARKPCRRSFSDAPLHGFRPIQQEAHK